MHFYAQGITHTKIVRVKVPVAVVQDARVKIAVKIRSSNEKNRIE